MPELPHLILPRAEVDLERRKRQGFPAAGVLPDPRQQAQKVRQAVDSTLAEHARLRAIVVDPHLIIRIRTAQPVLERAWEKAGLTVLGQESSDSIVLFSSDRELKEFQRRVGSYAAPLKNGQKNPSYSAIIGAIKEFRPIAPIDRIGSALREEGFEAVSSFEGTRRFLVDVELWEIGTQAQREDEVAALERELSARGAEITDRYIGLTFTVLRVEGRGGAVQWLLGLPSVRTIDLPPQIDLDVERLLATTITNIGTVEPPEPDAPLIGVIDSGVNDAHPLLASVVVDRIATPPSLGLSDDWGHGSQVSGVAAYGDVRACLEARRFKAAARLLSSKVVNGDGQFDERQLITSQMADTVRALHQRGCRIFNISLGDSKKVYDGAKPGTWTALLDELARELDVLFVVSAGNYGHRTHDGPEEHLTEYPRYLLDAPSRIYEPANAANVLTVGAIASAAALEEHLPGNISSRPIAGMGEPAPFTRAGFGIADAIKPDLCDDGGNTFYDGVIQGVRRQAQSEILTTSSRYIERLFTTAVGTSYAAPLVAHKAAQVLRTFPEASANLLRALLVNSARVPPAASSRLAPFGEEATLRLCGFGVANADAAANSDRNRIVLYADDEIGMDRFYVYEIPVPPVFIETQGRRYVRVTLAFDSPTRHTRAAYLGVEMSFRLVRGKSLEEVQEHYRKRNVGQEGSPPDIKGRYDCKFDMKPSMRERGTLQSSTFMMQRNPPTEDGNIYHLVVRCERQWFPDELARQRFAVVVELGHVEDMNLYERVRERVGVPRIHLRQ